jgi:hypothetical protein
MADVDWNHEDVKVTLGEMDACVTRGPDAADLDMRHLPTHLLLGRGACHGVALRADSARRQGFRA